MELSDRAMERLGKHHAEERAFVRQMTRRYDTAARRIDKAKCILEEAEADRLNVLREWATTVGWGVRRVADHTGLSQREVSDAGRAVSRRQEQGAVTTVLPPPRSTRSHRQTAPEAVHTEVLAKLNPRPGEPEPTGS